MVEAARKLAEVARDARLGSEGQVGDEPTSTVDLASFRLADEVWAGEKTTFALRLAEGDSFASQAKIVALQKLESSLLAARIATVIALGDEAPPGLVSETDRQLALREGLDYPQRYGPLTFHEIVAVEMLACNTDPEFVAGVTEISLPILDELAHKKGPFREALEHRRAHAQARTAAKEEHALDVILEMGEADMQVKAIRARTDRQRSRAGKDLADLKKLQVMAEIADRMTKPHVQKSRAMRRWREQAGLQDDDVIEMLDTAG